MITSKHHVATAGNALCISLYIHRMARKSFGISVFFFVLTSLHNANNTIEEKTPTKKHKINKYMVKQKLKRTEKIRERTHKYNVRNKRKLYKLKTKRIKLTV